MHPHLPKLSSLLAGLNSHSVTPAKVVIISSPSSDRAEWNEDWVAWQDFISEGVKRKLGRDATGEILWRRQSFDWPLWILFSSGTTGLPKPIVHRAGGMLLQSNKASAPLSATPRVLTFSRRSTSFAQNCLLLMSSFIILAVAG